MSKELPATVDELTVGATYKLGGDYYSQEVLANNNNLFIYIGQAENDWPTFNGTVDGMSQFSPDVPNSAEPGGDSVVELVSAPAE